MDEALLSPNYSFPTTPTLDSSSFIKAIEPELINIYGNENISNEKPYEIYHFGRYWVAFGTMPSGFNGGIFKIVIDSQKSNIIYLEHGK